MMVWKVETAEIIDTCASIIPIHSCYPSLFKAAIHFLHNAPIIISRCNDEVTDLSSNKNFNYVAIDTLTL